MKKNLFNITKALLLGLAFVAVGCSDYDEDIKDLNNRIDAVTSKITGEIDLTKVDLDNTKKDLNSAKEALAALQVKHDADIAALKASDETLKSSIADANAAIVALKGDLSDAEAALNNKVDGVQAELNAKIAAEIATVNEKIAAAEAQIEGLKENVSDLNSKDAELDKKIADLGEDMAALKAELNALISKNADGIAANADAIKALQDNMAQQAQIFVEYKAAVAAQIAALEAKDAQIDSSIATINDAIVRIDASIEAIQSGKVNVKDFEAYQEEVKAQYTTLEDAIFALEYADIKFNKTDKELSDRIYNLKTNLESRLNEAFGNIGANTSAIAALQSEVAANLAKINATNNTLNSAIQEFTSAIDALEAKDKALDAKDEELSLEIVAKYAALAKEIEGLVAKDKAIEADIKAKYDDVIEKINALIAKDADLEKAIADECAKISADLAAKYDQLAAADAALASEFAAECAKIAADFAAADEAIKADVKAKYDELSAKYDELAAADEEIKSDVKANADAIAANLATLKAADAALAAEIAAKYEELAAADADLASEFAAECAKLAADFAAADNAIKADVKAKYDELSAKYAELAAADEAIKADVKANADAIADNYKELTAADAALAAEIAAKYEELTDALATQYDELAAADAAIEERCDAIEDEIAAEIANRTAADAAINADLKAKYDELIANCEALVKADKDILAKIDAEVKKLTAKDDEISKIVAANYAELTTKAAGLQDQIDMLMLVTGVLTAENKEQAAALETLATQYEELAKDLLDKYEELKEADAALAQADKDLESRLTAEFAEALQKSDAKEAVAFAEVWEKIKAMDADLAAKYAELVGKDKELSKWIANVSGTVDKNAVRIGELEKAASDLKAQHAEFKVEVSKAIDNLQAGINDNGEKIAKLDEKTTTALQGLQDALNDAIADVMNTIDAVKTELEENINKLMSRIQSVVYVPDYDDGKATIKYAKMSVAGANEEKIIEAASKMKYQVYPATCAKAIVEAYETNTSTLRFDVRPVKPSYTRLGAAPAALNIKSVDLFSEDDGVIEITFEARNFSPAFYNGDEPKDEDENSSYSASLIVDYKDEFKYSSANLSSCYTNLVPSDRKTENITVSLANVPAAGFDTLFIEYTMRNSNKALEFEEGFEKYGKKNVLEGLNVVYSINGGEAKTYAQMIEAGYDVAVPEFSYAVKGYNHDPGVTVTENNAENGQFTEASLLSFFDYDNIKDGEELAVAPATRKVATTIQPVVWLTADATASTVGSKLEYTGTYDVDGFELSANQFVVVAPNSVQITTSPAKFVWNYADDAAADASRLDADESNDIPYARGAFEFEISEKELAKLDGLSLVDVYKSKTSKIEGLDGASINAAVPSDNAFKFSQFSKFEWNKTYTLKYKFANNKSVEVEFVFVIETEDRPRDVEVKIEKVENVELKKNISFTALKDMSLESIYSTLKGAYVLGEITKDDFLADVLVTNEPVEAKALKASDGNSYPVVDPTTTITVNGGAKTANVSFDYNDFSTFIPTQVVYTDEITLWYGQKVNLTYTVNFDMPKAAYNFNHVDLWVKSGANGIYSDVQGNYSPNKESVALTSFSVSNIDMDKAFIVVDKAGKVVSNRTELGLVTKFEIEDDTTAPDMKGIEFTGNVLAYNGKTDFVNVKGNLYLQHDNLAKIALETKFDPDSAYANYVVNKFDPFTALVPEDTIIYISEVQEYKLDVRSRFSIYESRDGSGNATKLGNGDGFTVDILGADGSYIVGNGTNGWAALKTINAIYGGIAKPKMTFTVADSEIPDMYAHVIKYVEGDRMLSFDNTPNLELDKAVTIKVVATIDYTWGKKEAELKVTFQPKK